MLMQHDRPPVTIGTRELLLQTILIPDLPMKKYYVFSLLRYKHERT